MAVSKAVVPLLRGEASGSIQRTLCSAKVKPYTQAERDATSKTISEILDEKKHATNNNRRTH